MAIYYVDLDLATSGHVGSMNDPFSFEDYIYANLTNDDIIYLRGSKICDYYVMKPGIHKGWDLKKYGPWRLYAVDIINNFYYNNTSFNDCIIKTGTLSISVGKAGIYYEGSYNTPSFTIANSIIYADLIEIYHGGTIEPEYPLPRAEMIFKGSVLLVNSIGDNGEPNSDNRVTFIDCIIIQVGEPSGLFGFFGTNNNVTFKNCVCNRKLENSPGLSIEFNVIDSQEDWIPEVPEWPDWDAPKEEFNNPLLYSGIQSPPQPGNPPYEGYETDLFGNPRNGIGTGYMSSSEPGEDSNFVVRNVPFDKVDDIMFNVSTVGHNLYWQREVSLGKVEYYTTINSIKGLSEFLVRPYKCYRNTVGDVVPIWMQKG